MSASIHLLTAQISFLEGRVALVHIPLSYYPFFLQPIQRLLFGEDHDDDAHQIPWPYRHSFLNVSITPVECSVVCSRALADRFFKPLVDRFNQLSANSTQIGRVHISPEDFGVIQVDGQGLDAGQRVLELTAPLALAGISIFFETTYFSDYILVPHARIYAVTKILEQRGFTFSPSASAYVSEHSPSSPQSPRHTRQSSSGNPFDFPTNTPKPNTPPASNLADLQTQTFAKLRRAGISPTVDRTIRLVSCAGRKEANPAVNDRLQHDLIQILLATCPEEKAATDTARAKDGDTKGRNLPTPDHSTTFLSLTLTSDEPISLLLESRLLSSPTLRLASTLLFSHSSHPPYPYPEHSPEPAGEVFVPITLDLRTLPLEATGIVCGVAGRLAQGTSRSQVSAPAAAASAPVRGKVEENSGAGELGPKSAPVRGDSPSGEEGKVERGGEEEEEEEEEEEREEAGAVEISFLSTARAGTVIVKERELNKAVRALAGAESDPGGRSM